MGWTYVSKADAAQQSITKLWATIPACDPGDLLLLIFIVAANVTLTTPTGWTQMAHAAASVTRGLYCKKAGYEPSRLLVTHNGAPSDMLASIVRIQGNDGDLVYDAIATNTSGGNPPSVTSVHHNCSIAVIEAGGSSFSGWNASAASPDFPTSPAAAYSGSGLPNVNLGWNIWLKTTALEPPAAYDPPNGNPGPCVSTVAFVSAGAGGRNVRPSISLV